MFKYNPFFDGNKRTALLDLNTLYVQVQHNLSVNDIIRH